MVQRASNEAKKEQATQQKNGLPCRRSARLQQKGCTANRFATPPRPAVTDHCERDLTPKPSVYARKKHKLCTPQTARTRRTKKAACVEFEQQPTTGAGTSSTIDTETRGNSGNHDLVDAQGQGQLKNVFSADATDVDGGGTKPRNHSSGRRRTPIRSSRQPAISRSKAIDEASAVDESAGESASSTSLPEQPSCAAKHVEHLKPDTAYPNPVNVEVDVTFPLSRQRSRRGAQGKVPNVNSAGRAEDGIGSPTDQVAGCQVEGSPSHAKNETSSESSERSTGVLRRSPASTDGGREDEVCAPVAGEPVQIGDKVTSRKEASRKRRDGEVSPANDAFDVPPCDKKDSQPISNEGTPAKRQRTQSSYSPPRPQPTSPVQRGRMSGCSPSPIFKRSSLERYGRSPGPGTPKQYIDLLGAAEPLLQEVEVERRIKGIRELAATFRELGGESFRTCDQLSLEPALPPDYLIEINAKEISANLRLPDPLKDLVRLFDTIDTCISQRRSRMMAHASLWSWADGVESLKQHCERVSHINFNLKQLRQVAWLAPDMVTLDWRRIPARSRHTVTDQDEWDVDVGVLDSEGAGKIQEGQ